METEELREGGRKMRARCEGVEGGGFCSCGGVWLVDSGFDFRLVHGKGNLGLSLGRTVEA